MNTFIAIIMYFPRLFLLFIGKQHCLDKKKKKKTKNMKKHVSLYFPDVTGMLKYIYIW